MTKTVMDKVVFLRQPKPENSAKEDFKRGIESMIDSQKEIARNNFMNSCMFLFMGALFIAQSLPKLDEEYLDKILRG